MTAGHATRELHAGRSRLGGRGRLSISRLAVRVAIGLAILLPLFPLYWLVISALKDPAEFLQAPPTWFPEHPTFGVFGQVFKAVPFGQSFLNSVIIAGTATVCVLVTSVMAGYVFAKYRFRGRDTLFWTVVATMFVPPIVTLVPLYWLVSSMGLSDSYVGVLLPWLANAFGIFLMRQFITEVPDELIDAARVDGAGELRILVRIVTPELTPALVTLGVFAFVYYWNNFLWPLTILHNTSQFPIVLSLAQLLSFSMAVKYQNVVLAGALIASLPTLIVFLFAQRVFVQGISRSGVRG
jgi:multiple sugar transport system permease protein